MIEILTVPTKKRSNKETIQALTQFATDIKDRGFKP